MMNKKKELYLTCKDYNVSRETFKLLLEVETDMLVTFPQPIEKDLGKYYESESYISHTDSKKNLFDKAYQFAKNYAIKKKINLLKRELINTKTDINILDVGCGTGDFIIACKKQKWNVVGVEPNPNAQKLIHKKILKNPEKLIEISESIEQVNQNQQFDIITLWHVLEHVSNLDLYIKKLNKLLKPNGTLIIAVPNYKSYDAKYYKEFWAAYDVPRHLWHFSKKSIKMLFKKEQLKIKKILPMKMDSYYVSLLSEKNKNGKLNYIKAILIGLISNLKAISSKEYSSLIYILKNE